MDWHQRKVAAEILHTQTVLGYHITHELARTAGYYSDGLTEKEQVFLKARHKAISEELSKLTKLRERLITNGRHGR